MNIEDNITDKKYTLVVRGEVTLNWNDLEFLEDALGTVPSTASTFIHYNDPGIEEYENDHS